MQHTRPDSPSHQPGVHKGEEWSRHDTEPGRGKSDPGARNSTGINADKRRPIDPRMPNYPPA
ncbi:MAG: hypothetical protein WAM71_14490 [Candidatus Korobacteraceae bacterium]